MILLRKEKEKRDKEIKICLNIKDGKWEKFHEFVKKVTKIEQSLKETERGEEDEIPKAEKEILGYYY